jgi:NAD(P)-dependent dehydrogenase (short-subunit alcohol dehydrogenase family)
MIAQKTGGSIIFLASIAGSRVLHPQQQCAYNASKAAVRHLAKSLAAEWAQHGIHVNKIAPGYMDTALNREALLESQKKHWAAMTPMGRLGQPDELNGLAVLLASDASRFIMGAHILADVSQPPRYTKILQLTSNAG